MADRDPADISPNRIADAVAVEKLRGITAHKLLLNTWLKALRNFLVDDALSTPEIAYLDRLRHALGLSSKEVLEAERELTHPRFHKAVAAVLADRHVSDQERTALSTLAERLRLPEEAQQKIYGELARPLLQSTVDEMIRDQRLSSEEQRTFDALAKNLGITVAMNEKTRIVLDRYALFWRIENGDFPRVDAPINLQRGEVCYFSSAASWHELRVRTTRIDYAGISKSIRVVGGVRLRLGSIVPRPIRTEELVEIDRGALYVTNKRIIFDGSRKNTAIRLTNLIALQVYSDAIVLEKATGRSPHLMLEDGELAGVIISNAMIGA